MAKNDTFMGIVGAVLVGGIWVVALGDYIAAPGGPNQAGEIIGETITNFYSTLEGHGAPTALPVIAGVGG